MRRTGPLAAPVLGLLIACAPALVQADPGTFEAMQVIRPRQPIEAPAFRLEDLQGQTIELEAYRGRPLVLAFWASWCRSCKGELASLARLWRDFEAEGLAVLAISIDRDLEAARREVDDLALPFPVMIDPDRRVASRYEVSGVPTSYLIGPDGHFRGLVIGERDWNSSEARRLVSSLLPQPGTADTEGPQAGQ